ncbi:MAG: hypothetical protein AAF773_14165 [Cyanobacteria bacterium P01_D01_bin.115]
MLSSPTIGQPLLPIARDGITSLSTPLYLRLGKSWRLKLSQTLALAHPPDALTEFSPKKNALRLP